MRQKWQPFETYYAVDCYQLSSARLGKFCNFTLPPTPAIMQTKNPEEKLAYLQSQLDHLKKNFDDLISHEAEFEKLKPIRMQIRALEKAIAAALNEIRNPEG